MNKSTRPLPHESESASSWVQRWTHLVRPQSSVLDIACGHGRHMRWFADNGHRVTGLDRSPDAISAAAAYGEAVLADIEGGPWPLMSGERPCQYDAVVVTNYLWRPLFPVIAQSLARDGVLIYETFAIGNETVGKPSRPDFLLQPAELLNAFHGMRVIAFEDGFLDNPPRFVQRIAAIQPGLDNRDAPTPKRYPL